MGLVLARAEQYDDRDARRESGHGGRSLDWGRPIAPVAHRTERSAPDRKAAGSIPARRTSIPFIEIFPEAIRVSLLRACRRTASSRLGPFASWYDRKTAPPSIPSHPEA